jgi:hypothetical protein
VTSKKIMKRKKDNSEGGANTDWLVGVLCASILMAGVVLAAVPVQMRSTTDPTLVSPESTQFYASNSVPVSALAALLAANNTWTGTNTFSATNHVLGTASRMGTWDFGTSSKIKVTASGSDSNIGFDFVSKNSGVTTIGTTSAYLNVTHNGGGVVQIYPNGDSSLSISSGGTGNVQMVNQNGMGFVTYTDGGDYFGLTDGFGFIIDGVQLMINGNWTFANGNFAVDSSPGYTFIFIENPIGDSLLVRADSGVDIMRAGAGSVRFYDQVGAGDLTANMTDRVFGGAWTGNSTFTINGARVGSTIQTVAAGTAYTMTASYANLDFGTTDPTITLTGASGRAFNVYVDVQTAFSGATYAAIQDLAFKARRTNNTAADVGTERGQPIPVMTTLTGRGPSVLIGPIPYTTAGTDDILTIQGVLSATPSAGSVTVVNATITAIPK